MKRYVTKDTLAIAKDHIKTKGRIRLTKNYTKYANCYTYALNLNLPIYTNIGDICDKYDPHYGLDDFEELFIEDCNALDIDVCKVSPTHELSEEDSWLVSLYGTDYFTRDGIKYSDFHFVKKSRRSNWSGKVMGEKPTYIDGRGKRFNDASDALFGIYDDNKNVVYYNYIGTYKLSKR